MSTLKGITYAKKPEIGIPLAFKAIISGKNKEEYILSVLYLGYRVLDGTFEKIKDYKEYLCIAINFSKEIGNESTNGYRLYLSLCLLRTYLSILLPEHFYREENILKNAYDLGIIHPCQISNYSKLGTLLYYNSNEDIMRKDILEKIKTSMFAYPSLESMSVNAINDVVLPLLSNDISKIDFTIKKYTTWYIYKDFLKTLKIIKDGNKKERL
jgi:hypothetical protein